MEWVGWDFSLELILFSQSVQHLGPQWGSGCVSSRHRASLQRAEPSPGIPTGRDLRKWGIWSIPVCAEGEEPPGSPSQREDKHSKLLDLSPFLQHQIIITKLFREDGVIQVLVFKFSCCRNWQLCPDKSAETNVVLALHK